MNVKATTYRYMIPLSAMRQRSQPFAPQSLTAGHASKPFDRGTAGAAVFPLSECQVKANHDRKIVHQTVWWGGFKPAFTGFIYNGRGGC